MIRLKQKWTWRSSSFHSIIEIVDKRLRDLDLFHLRFRLEDFYKFVFNTSTCHQLQLIERKFRVIHCLELVE